LLPLPVLIAVSHLPRRRFVFLSLTATLALQLFVTNIFVRYIGTDLTDPPAPPPAIALRQDATPPYATWEGGISLRSVSIPAAVGSDRSIAINAIWTTSQRINRPYTIFVHLYDAQGNLVAQRDTMPMNGRWPTTCWRAGDSFQDRYTLVAPDTAQAGAYRVALGFYWLSTGERLPVSGQGPGGSRSVDIGTLEIGGADQR
jgi:hypothetical protein